MGKPLPGIDIKITNPDTGETLTDGNIGQIEVRGPNVFKGYWKMPEKTREELREDGFFITGDLGRIDDFGYLQIVGRNKDLIISGGYNIYPKEIELVLDDLPGVLESAVIGAPHSDFGESVIGLLVAEGGQSLDLKAIEEVLARVWHGSNGRVNCLLLTACRAIRWARYRKIYFVTNLAQLLKTRPNKDL